jgi:hypothetical protein
MFKVVVGFYNKLTLSCDKMTHTLMIKGSYNHIPLSKLYGLSCCKPYNAIS